MPSCRSATALPLPRYGLPTPRRAVSVTIRSGLCGVLLLAVTGNASAQLQVDRFYPPVVSAGGETIVQAEGKFPNWPVQIACGRDDVEVTAQEKSGHFSIRVPVDAAPGIAWVRCYDNASASSLVPLLIAPLATVEETEPNNKPDEATPVELPAVLFGRLDKSNEVDTFRLKLSKGQTLVATATAHQHLRSPMDAVMQLVDLKGNVILQADDDRGLDPQLTFHAHEDGEWLVRLFAFPETPNSTIGYAGGSSFVYTLRITDGAFLDHALPLVVPSEPSDRAILPVGWNLPAEGSPQQTATTADVVEVTFFPNVLGWQAHAAFPGDAAIIHETDDGSPAETSSLPCIYAGHIATAKEIDRLRFEVQESKRYEAIVHSRAFGFPLDSVLRIVDLHDGTEVARNDDGARDQYDAAINFTAKRSGQFELQVSDLVNGHGPRYAYSIVVDEARPSVDLTVAEDHFMIKAGQSLEIPVTISRRNGFDQPLVITVEGLPAGIQADPVTSEPKGETAKAVKLKLTATAEAATSASAVHGSFRILGQAAATEAANAPSTYVASYALRDTLPIRQLWLTAIKEAPAQTPNDK